MPGQGGGRLSVRLRCALSLALLAGRRRSLRRRAGRGGDVSAGLPGDSRPSRAHGADRDAVLAGRPRVRRREGRSGQGVRQPLRPRRRRSTQTSARTSIPSTTAASSGWRCTRASRPSPTCSSRTRTTPRSEARRRAGERPDADSDPCPTPPGPTLDGCVISGRLSKLTPGSGGTATYRDSVLADSPPPTGAWARPRGRPRPTPRGNGRTGSYLNTPTLGVAGALTGDSNTAVAYNGTNEYVQRALRGSPATRPPSRSRRGRT